MHSFPDSTVALSPSPGMHHLGRKVGIPRLPAKLVARAGGVGNKGRRIARPPRTDPDRKSAAGDLPDAGDQLANGPAAPGAEIERRTLCAVEQCAYCVDVSIGEIGHMDIIAHASAIGGRIIITVNCEVCAFSRCRVEQERDYMCFWNVALADLTVGICPCGIEVTQRNMG